VSAPGFAANEAMLDLLKILRDKGSISQEEYELLVNAAKSDAEVVEDVKTRMEARVKDIPKIDTKGKLKITSSDGDFEWQPIGRIMADYSWIHSDKNKLGSGAEIRRARLGMEGLMWKHWIWKLELDFADAEVAMKDAYIGYKDGNWWIKAGQQHIPFGFATLSSSKYMLFTERPFLADGTLQLARHLGVAAFTHGDSKRWTLHGGIFAGPDGEDPDVCLTGFDECDEQWSVAARGTFLPWMQDDSHLVNIGGAVWYRDPLDSEVRVRQRPGIWHVVDDRFVDANFGVNGVGRPFGADDILAFNAEALLVYGPFSLGGEYTRWDVNTEPAPSGATPPDDASLDGYYVEAAYFLTGESMVFKTSKAQYDKVKPKGIVGKGGIGAWQVAARYDAIDLNDADAGLTGGEMRGVAFGLNWYVTENMRMMASFYRILETDRFGNRFDDDEPYGLTVRGQVFW